MGNFYGDFTIEEAKNIGAKHKVKCKANYGYEDALTVGKEYEIEVTPRILSMSPLCRGFGDKGKKFECHLERFEKIKEKENDN